MCCEELHWLLVAERKDLANDQKRERFYFGLSVREGTDLSWESLGGWTKRQMVTLRLQSGIREHAAARWLPSFLCSVRLQLWDGCRSSLRWVIFPPQ